MEHLVHTKEGEVKKAEPLSPLQYTQAAYTINTSFTNNYSEGWVPQWNDTQYIQRLDTNYYRYFDKYAWNQR